MHTRRYSRWFLVLAGTLAIALLPAWGAGFAIYEQGGKAMGMAGAFTAQADDPSAMFHNVGGLGMMHERSYYAGLSLISLGDSEFRGAAPFPGPTQTGQQADQVLVIPHLYWVEPINDDWTFGLAINAPFGLAVEWDNPDTWSGRFISERSALEALDVSPNFAVQVNDDVGIGFGVVLRGSSLELKQRGAAINPFTQNVEEVSRNVLESDIDWGYGFTAGIFSRENDFFAWGFNYRSEVDIDYGGDAMLTQVLTGDPVFDAIVAGQLPFGMKLPLETEVTFPAMAQLGLAFHFTDNVVFESDLIWTGWNSFDKLELTFAQNPSLNDVIPQNYSDSFTYRFGLAVDTSERSQWRFGAYYDESPQPAETVGPILPDADRMGFTLGYGLSGKRVQSDFYVMYLPFDDRTTNVNQNNFNGSYETTAFLLGATFGF